MFDNNASCVKTKFVTLRCAQIEKILKRGLENIFILISRAKCIGVLLKERKKTFLI